MPFNQRVGHFWDVRAVYSDDRGATWKLGDLVPDARATNAKGGVTSMLNEVQMVELQDGSVRLNSRQADGRRFRKTAISRDGGQTWSKAEQVPQLADPACMGSILRYAFAAMTTKSCILYSGPEQHETRKRHGRMSVTMKAGPGRRARCSAKAALPIRA